FAAWRSFSRWLQRGWRAIHRELGLRPSYFRAFEWTPGSDLRGHPHFHIWLLCPFIDFHEALEEWRKALIAAGVVFAPGETPILDIREIVARPNEFMHELVKGDDAIKFSLVVTTRAGEDVAEYITGWSLAAEILGSRVPV